MRLKPHCRLVNFIYTIFCTCQEPLNSNEGLYFGASAAPDGFVCLLIALCPHCFTLSEMLQKGSTILECVNYHPIVFLETQLHVEEVGMADFMRLFVTGNTE